MSPPPSAPSGGARDPVTGRQFASLCREKGQVPTVSEEDLRCVLVAVHPCERRAGVAAAHGDHARASAQGQPGGRGREGLDQVPRCRPSWLVHSLAATQAHIPER